MAFGPGILVTNILFSICSFTSLYPGSDINGDPASEIKATGFSLMNLFISLIILSSL